MVRREQLDRFSLPEGKIDISVEIDRILDKFRRRERDAPELLQSIRHILYILKTLFKVHPEYLRIMETILEPEMQYSFRVAWIDDNGKQRVNRGYRIHQSSALGPYKGGLRFHPTVTDSVVRFLALEQTFKNALTGIALGSGKGGSDFDPKGKSENEIMRFCQSFMIALHKHIGPTVDVPAGDIGVGGREIGYLYGQYKRLQNRVECSITGKHPNFGGSLLRPEATGYGVGMIADYAIRKKYLSNGLHNCKCNISGSGNVAIYLAEYLLTLDATVQTFSDSTGMVYCEKGFDTKKLHELMKIKFENRQSLKEISKTFDDVRFITDSKPWSFDCDYAFPCATQNELDLNDAERLLKGGCKGAFEGANMPLTIEAMDFMVQNNALVIPGIAANCGGVAVSGFEMAQNAQRTTWSRSEVQDKLQNLMQNAYDQCEHACNTYNTPGDLVSGAYMAGFLKIVEAVTDQGCV